MFSMYRLLFIDLIFFSKRLASSKLLQAIKSSSFIGVMFFVALTVPEACSFILRFKSFVLPV